MPPAKARASAAHDDKFDDPSTAKKLIQSAVVGRGRRPAAAANHTSAGKESSSGIRPDRTAQTNGKIAHKSSRSSQSPWSTAPTSVLLAYRSSYRLTTPSCFDNPHAHEILETGIGRYSPTMARPRSKRRVAKEQLALTVRKHFNSLPVNENEVLVDLLYKVKTKEKSLRLKFPATKSR